MQFVIFPDDPAAVAVAAQLQGDVVEHPSGRPWIVGRWRHHDIVLAEAGNRRLVLLGTSATTVDVLREWLGRLTGPHHLTEIAQKVPGSYFMVASFEGTVVAHGSASGVRMLFHAAVGGTVVLADRPQVLAELAGTGIDESLVAQSLLVPGPPWPLNHRCGWSGVDSLAPENALWLEPGGRQWTTRWWNMPEADDSMAVAARRVREALAEAVATRRTHAVSSDMSGGMDSTSISFLASRSNEPLLTVQLEAVDPSNDDATWATEAARNLPSVEHLVMPRSTVPLDFADLLNPDHDAEGPFAWFRGRAMLRHQAKELAARGIEDHLTGHGGDELFYVMPADDHSAVRANPLAYMHHFRSNRYLRRWGWWGALRYLSDGHSYSGWLRTAARGFGGGSGRTSQAGWADALRLPSWVTTDAADRVRADLLAAADGLAPLSPWRSQHARLDGARRCGDAVRRADRFTMREGVSWHAPYLDDRVIEAALSLRFKDRVEANRYKPLLVDGMRGVVPDDILGRPTKGEFSVDVYEGMRKYKGELLKQCEDLRLGQLGLVDPAAVRAALLAPHPDPRSVIYLERTLGCEAWLRSAHTHRPLTASGGTR